jgi:hypothetical protein|tara:strand:+ start:187 stop:564 length:378 start_codon:yes stop_codon:yes gene_type:complete
MYIKGARNKSMNIKKITIIIAAIAFLLSGCAITPSPRYQTEWTETSGVKSSDQLDIDHQLCRDIGLDASHAVSDKSNSSGGGMYSGILAGMQQQRTKNNAKRLAFKSCMTQLGWNGERRCIKNCN